MSMTNLNANVGIDLGSNTSKIAHNNKIIAAIDGFNILFLREEAEIYFDEPVFSCVVAVPDSFTNRQREDLIFNAKKSGFKYINLITSSEAMINALTLKNHERVLVYDFGASKSNITIFEGEKILETEFIKDISGDEFDNIFAEWLSERFTLNLIDKKTLRARANLIKIALSSNNFVVWRNVEITQDDFERLIRFSVKRVSHAVERFIDCYAPKRFIITGGCSEIPIVKRTFREIFSSVEFDSELIAKGAALKARLISGGRKNQERSEQQAKLRELRGELIKLEDLLTRKQKDRLYFLFKQAEGIFANNPAIIKLMENMLQEIKD